MKCSNCGVDNRDGEMFCVNCGSELYSGENVTPESKVLKKKKPSLSDKIKNGLMGGSKKNTDTKEVNDPKAFPEANPDMDIHIPKDDIFSDPTLPPEPDPPPLITDKKPDEKKKSSEGKGSRPEDKKKSPDSTKAANEKGGKGTPSAERRRQIKRRRTANIAKIVLIAAAVIGVIILIVWGVSSVKAGTGKRLADKVPLGRNIEYCQKETEVEFSKSSAFPQLKNVASFSYIYEDSKSVNISGIEMPRWAVLLTSTGSNITKVEYFDFRSLSGGWKGKHSDVILTKESVSYGMDERAASKAIGFDPYYVKRTSDNKSVKCYRYYIIDNETGLERVFNYYVEFNDVNGTVVNAYDREISYVNYVLGV